MKKKLILIDGANYIFRAYYAIRPLSTSYGLPTNAIYGFIRMLLKIMRDLKPDYWAVIFDSKEPTFREKEYSEYKANRKKPPDDLVQQFPHFPRVIDAFSVPALSFPGYEADDIIATIVKRESSPDLEILILSGDKDLMQLVSDDVKILDEMKGLTVGKQEVYEKLGVYPERVVDLLSLSGDSSDNVPGVSGIGLKGAAKLISEYNGLDFILQNTDKIKGSVGKKIQDGRDMAILSKRLVELAMDVPVDYSLKDLNRIDFDVDKVRPILKEFEFSKLLSEIAPEKGLDFSHYRLITKEDDLRDYLRRAVEKGILSFDLETTSLNVIDAKIAGISLAYEHGEAVYVPIGHDLGEQLNADFVLKELEKILCDPNVKKVGQNLNYDLSILKNHGIEILDIYFDTMLASYLINPSAQHGLDALSELYLGHHMISYEDVTGKGKDQILFSKVDLQTARDYACEDADVALRLFERFEQELKDESLYDLFTDMELPLIHVLVDMQLKGMKADKEKLKNLGAEFGEKLAELEKQIFSLSGFEFNIGSPSQLGEILFVKMGIPGGRKTKTGFSTDQGVLEKLAPKYEIAKLVLNYRSISKLKHTYADSLMTAINQRTGRIHTSFNQVGTATGRLSSSGPNLQNIPARTQEGRKIKSCFIAEDGFKFISADYSQIELRILAHVSDDEVLVKAFLDGLDVHTITASGIFGVKVKDVTSEQRSVGKTINFSVLYGQSPYGLSEMLGISPSEAKDYIDNYFKRYPKVAHLRDKVIEETKRTQVVKTIFGRRRFLPDINSRNQSVENAAQRAAFNTVFQGSAADIMKKAMIAVHKDLKNVSADSNIVMQVHDELLIESRICDVEKVSQFVKEKMETAVKLSVPLLVDVNTGFTWADV